MSSDLDKAISTTLAIEGGWADHRADPGGKTMYGITHGTLKKAYRSGIMPHNNIRALTIKQARAIYKAMYWDTIKAEDLPRGLNVMVFDIAVNSGPKSATVRLQNALNYVGKFGLAVDGKIGNRTLGAAHEMNGKPYGIFKLLGEVATNRQLHWSRLSHWGTFSRGWTRRGHRVLIEATRMADGTI